MAVSESLLRRQEALVRDVLDRRAAGDAAGEKQLTGELLVTLRPVFWSVIKRVRARAGTLSAQDLEQVCAMAVIKSLDRYDAARGRQGFGPFAWFQALNACNEHIRLHAADVHVSEWAAKGRTVRQAEGREASAPRVAVDSFDAPAPGQDASRGSGTLARIEAARSAQPGHDAQPTPEALLEQAQLHASLHELVDALPRKEQELVSRVYGLNGKPSQSVRSLAQEWDAPKSRLDRMLARALDALRRALAGDEAP